MSLDLEALEVMVPMVRPWAVLLSVVTGVGSLIHIYSMGYMHGDPAYARYMAYLNLFLFFMFFCIPISFLLSILMFFIHLFLLVSINVQNVAIVHVLLHV